MNEKKRLLVYRITGLFFTILFLLLPTIINATTPTLELKNVECFTEYNETLEYSDCEIILTFNIPLTDYSGDIEIDFYDTNEEFIDQRSIYFLYTKDSSITEQFRIYGNSVEYYDVVNFEFTKNYSIFPSIFYFVAVISITFLISALFLSYKEYNYNGNKISVYAGFYHHTLKINNEIVDEERTIFSFIPIFLDSTIDDEIIEAKISTTNRISLKINNKLVQPLK